MDARKVIENIQGIYGGQTTDGTLRLTDFHLVFCAPISQPTGDSSGPPKTREKWIPYPIISHCSFRPTLPTSVQSPSIRIRCRDFTFITFNIPDNDAAREAFDFLKSRTCKLGTVEKLYAFCHKPLKMEREVKGWDLYDPKAEFRRQGISEKLPDKGWRVTHINKDYSFCDTYPGVMAVPSSISDNVLKYAKDFRSRNRIPALSYIHPTNNCVITRSSQPKSGITRKTNVQDEKLVCASFATMQGGDSGDSTPRSSQQDTSSEFSTLKEELTETERGEDAIISKGGAMYDEKTGQRLIFGASQLNLIVDARPLINSMANQIQGLGSENMDKYKFAQKVFLSIENIHTMRNSLHKVIAALKDTDLSPLPPNREQLANSGWLTHIHDVLDGSAIITRHVGIKSSNVLIHCSDGWDRTSQLSALSQIMLDPYFRTIDGFIVLVEKDWLSFGHNFRLRSGHLNHEDWFTTQRDALAGTKVQPGENDGRNDAFQNVLSGAKRFFNQQNLKDDPDLAAVSELTTGQVVEAEATVQRMISPIFHQFLDCTYQLLRQNKDRFEYNERFLRRLLYHLYSCQYGTFLYNSEKQRVDAGAAEKTSSVWDYFLSRRPEFTNPEFNPLIDDHIKGRERILLPRVKEIRWWHSAFGRTEDEMNGPLNTEFEAANERQAAMSSLHAPLNARREAVSDSEAAVKSPPGLTQSQSVLTAVENAHETLTPEKDGPSLRKSASAEGVKAFSAIREGISNLSIGKGVLGSLGSDAEKAPEPPASSRTDQEELRDIT